MIGGAAPILGRVLGCGEHVRVALDHLGVDRVDDLSPVEVTSGRGEAGQEDDLKKQVAQFATQGLPVLFVERRRDLVRLLQQVGPEVARGLFAIPGAALRPAEGLDQVEECFHPAA